MATLQNISLNTLTIEALHPLRFHQDHRPLKSSIKKQGLLVYPILLKQNQMLKVIDGVARLTVAKELGFENVSCFVYEERELGIPESFLLSLELNRWNRQFNLVEKAQALNSAFEIFGHIKSIPKDFWEMANIKANIRQVFQLREILKLAPHILKHAINNNFPIHTLLGFVRFPETERNTIANQLFLLPINQNKMSEILVSLYEISKRDEVLPSKILEQALSTNGKKLNPSERVLNLRDYLKKKRNPHYETLSHSFQALLEELSLDGKIRIEPADYFEEPYINLKARIDSKDDIKKLHKLITEKKLMPLVKITQDNSN